jgi:hypothetical protein
MNSVGLNSAQPAYNRGESTRAHGAVLHQSPQRFEYLRKNPTHYLTGSLTLQKHPPSSISSPPEVHDDEQCRAELR